MIPPEGKLLVRPEAAQLVTHGAEINVFTGKLTARSFRGRYQVVEAVFPAAGGEVMLSLELETAVPLPPVGDSVTIQLDPDLLQLLEGG